MHYRPHNESKRASIQHTTPREEGAAPFNCVPYDVTPWAVQYSVGGCNRYLKVGKKGSYEKTRACGLPANKMTPVAVISRC